MKTPRELLLEFLPSLVQDIVHELKESGESLLNDDGVDEKVCQQIADDLVETLAAKVYPPRVLIIIQGGAVQAVYCDKTVCSKVKDFDNIDAGEAESYLANADDWDQTSPVSQDELNDYTIEDVKKGANDVDSTG